MIYFYLNKHQKIFSVLISHLIQKTAKDIPHINKSFLRSSIIFKSIFKPLRTTGLNYSNYVNSIPGSGRSPRVGNGNPLQYSCLENSMGSKAWWATVHGITKRVRHDWTHTQMLFTAKPRKGSFILCPSELVSSLVTVKTFFFPFLILLCTCHLLFSTAPKKCQSTIFLHFKKHQIISVMTLPHPSILLLQPSLVWMHSHCFPVFHWHLLIENCCFLSPMPSFFFGFFPGLDKK